MFVLCPYILCAYLPRSFICLITACISACPSLTGLHAPIRPNITHSWGVASVALSVQCVTLMPGILEVYCTPYVNPPTDRPAPAPVAVVSFWDLLQDFIGLRLCPQAWLQQVPAQHPFLGTQVRPNGSLRLVLHRA